MVLLAVCQAHAQKEQEQAAADPQALSDESRTQIEERFGEIKSLKDEIAGLSQRLDDSEGLAFTITEARLMSVRSSLFDATLRLAKDLVAEQERGIAVDTFTEQLRADLEIFPEQATEAVERLAETIQFDYRELDPREAVLSDRKLLRAAQSADAVLSALIGYTEIAASMDLDASQQIGFLRETLANAAANRSIFLEVAISQVGLARSSSTALPKDEELLFWVAASEARVRVASSALQGTVNLMNRIGMDTRPYRQQIVTATGALTADVLDVGVFAGLISDWSKTVFNFTRAEGPRIVFSVLLAILIFFAFFRLSKLVRRGAEQAMLSRRVTMSHLLKRMVVSTARNLTIFIGILFALSQLGISLGPLLTGLGIAGFIIGFALQDTLSNFASGMMILIYRPFDVGDFVQAGGVTGKVDRMSLVNTTFKTFDNQVIVVPNNMIWQQVVTNLTAQKTRRVDLTFSISYGDDIDEAKAILQEVVENHEAVLKTPEPNIRVSSLTESGVELLCRPWVRTEDYWDALWDITERVKKRFDDEGITIPFPQRTVHTYTPNEA